MFSYFTCKNSRLIFRCCFQKSVPVLNVSSLQRCSIRFLNLPSNPLSKLSRKPILLDKTNYRIVYDFHYIKYIAAFTKTKISVPIASLVLSPFLIFFDETYVSSLITIVSAGCYFAFGLQASKLVENIVGKIYVNKEDKIKDVIISAIDSTGKRVDRLHSVEHIFNDYYPTKLSGTLGFIKLSTENLNLSYKVNIRNCKYIDQDACDYIFGFLYKEQKQTENNNRIESQSEALKEK